MDEMKTNFFNLMSPEEINFILSDHSKEEISSPQRKDNLRSEMVDILRHDRTGLLLLPFTKTKP
jgi:hypothetical protein